MLPVKIDDDILRTIGIKRPGSPADDDLLRGLKDIDDVILCDGVNGQVRRNGINFKVGFQRTAVTCRVGRRDLKGIWPLGQILQRGTRHINAPVAAGVDDGVQRRAA